MALAFAPPSIPTGTGGAPATPPARKKSKRPIILLVILLLAGLSAGSYMFVRHSAPQQPALKTWDNAEMSPAQQALIADPQGYMTHWYDVLATMTVQGPASKQLRTIAINKPGQDILWVFQRIAREDRARYYTDLQFVLISHDAQGVQLTVQGVGHNDHLDGKHTDRAFHEHITLVPLGDGMAMTVDE